MNKKYFIIPLFICMGIGIYKLNTQAMQISHLLNPTPAHQQELNKQLNQLVLYDRKEQALQLLHQGAEIKSLPQIGKNKILRWLEYSELRDLDELIKQALRAGADPKLLNPGYKIDAMVNAIEEDKIDDVKLWLKAGVDPNTKEPSEEELGEGNEPGHHLLYIAYLFEHTKIIKLLMQEGAELDALSSDEKIEIINYLNTLREFEEDYSSEESDDDQVITQEEFEILTAPELQDIIQNNTREDLDAIFPDLTAEQLDQLWEQYRQ